MREREVRNTIAADCVLQMVTSIKTTIAAFALFSTKVGDNVMFFFF